MSFYQVVVKGLLSNAGQLRNVHHYEFPDYVPTTVNLQAFVDNFDSDLKTRLQGVYHPNVAVLSYGMRRVDVANLPEAEFVATAGTWVGTAGAAQMPSPVSAMILFKAPTVYPRTTRTYLFPMDEGANEGSGAMTTVARTAVVNYGGDILTIVIAGATSAIKVAHEYTAAPRITLAANAVLTVVVPTIWRTQRRRRLGVGG